MAKRLLIIAAEAFLPEALYDAKAMRDFHTDIPRDFYPRPAAWEVKVLHGFNITLAELVAWIGWLAEADQHRLYTTCHGWKHKRKGKKEWGVYWGDFIKMADLFCEFVLPLQVAIDGRPLSVIWDMCYAGGVFASAERTMRSNEFHEKAIMRTTTDHRVPCEIADEKVAGRRVWGRNTAVIVACKRHQNALASIAGKFHCVDTKRQSFFTHCLIPAMYDRMYAAPSCDMRHWEKVIRKCNHHAGVLKTITMGRRQVVNNPPQARVTKRQHEGDLL